MTEINRPYTAAEKDRLVQILRKEAKFVPPDSVFLALIEMGKRLKLKRKEAIVKEGETDDNMYIIVDGVMRVWYNDGSVEVTHAFGSAGTMVHPMHCYYLNLPSPDTYEACCSTELLMIRREDFDMLTMENNDFARWLLSVSHLQLYHFELRRRVIRGDAAERYRKLVGHRPEIIQKVPLKIIASYLGITPEYLSAIRAKTY